VRNICDGELAHSKVCHAGMCFSLDTQGSSEVKACNAYRAFFAYLLFWRYQIRILASLHKARRRQYATAT